MELNELERLFVQAFLDQGIRPAFYHLLMQSDVCVITAAPLRSELPEIVSFRRDDGAVVVPFFTSLNALALNDHRGAEDFCVPPVTRMHTRTLLERVSGHYLHINPGSAFNLEVAPEHVASLLRDETIHYGTRAPEVPPDGAYIQIRKLNVSLPALEAALVTVFREVYEVRYAFLVEAERTRQGERMRTLMMIAESVPSEWLEKAVSTVFSDVYDHALPVDICFDEGDKDFVNTLKRIGAQPFYERATVGRFN
ncbi:SseB family protein [Dyella dinghuensis]|uniref:SseB family protein n=1 Tax=Dyella dinghuensis TaxID=1920169 RepID=UPI0013155F7B|nr:SseB family protein [Dyella dinghuensis]